MTNFLQKSGIAVYDMEPPVQLSYQRKILYSTEIA